MVNRRLSIYLGCDISLQVQFIYFNLLENLKISQYMNFKNILTTTLKILKNNNLHNIYTKLNRKKLKKCYYSTETNAFFYH